MIAVFRRGAVLAAVLSLLSLSTPNVQAEAAQPPAGGVETPCGVELYGPGSLEAREARQILSAQGVILRPTRLFLPNLSAWSEVVCTTALSRPGFRGRVRVVLLSDQMYLPSDSISVRIRDGMPIGTSRGPGAVMVAPDGDPADRLSSRAGGITVAGPDGRPWIILGVWADQAVLVHETGHAVEILSQANMSDYLIEREQLAGEAGVSPYVLSDVGKRLPYEVWAEDFAITMVPDEAIPPDAGRRPVALGSTMPWPWLWPEWHQALRSYFQSVLSRLDAEAGASLECSAAAVREIGARQELLLLQSGLADAEGDSLREFLTGLVAERERRVAEAAAARAAACGADR